MNSQEYELYKKFRQEMKEDAEVEIIPDRIKLMLVLNICLVILLLMICLLMIKNFNIVNSHLQTIYEVLV